jgi:hypothetical protein
MVTVVPMQSKAKVSTMLQSHDDVAKIDHGCFAQKREGNSESGALTLPSISTIHTVGLGWAYHPWGFHGHFK